MVFTDQRGSFDVVVVGAGIIGLGHALQQLRRGKRVAVFDRNPGVLGASIRNFGHIGVTTLAGDSRRYAERTRSLWIELANEVGFWLSQRGSTVVARSNTEMQLLEELAELKGSSEVVVLGKSHITDTTPVRDPKLMGGAQFERDLQLDSRVAVPRLAEWLAEQGVDFFWNTTVQSVASRVVVTSRGRFSAEQIMIAVNYHVDQYYPDLAERVGIKRCNLQMLAIRPSWNSLIDSPLLTGWSMVRYSAFRELETHARLCSELHTQHPALKVIDLNQMYAQRRDGTVVVGDSHEITDHELVFQDELTNRVLERETAKFFGLTELTVVERWQGVYASARDEFLAVEAEPGVWVTSVTTGIGMSCGLGFIAEFTESLEDSAQKELKFA